MTCMVLFGSVDYIHFIVVLEFSKGTIQQLTAACLIASTRKGLILFDSC